MYSNSQTFIGNLKKNLVSRPNIHQAIEDFVWRDNWKGKEIH